MPVVIGGVVARARDHAELMRLGIKRRLHAERTTSSRRSSAALIDLCAAATRLRPILATGGDFVATDPARVPF